MNHIYCIIFDESFFTDRCLLFDVMKTFLVQEASRVGGRSYF